MCILSLGQEDPLEEDMATPLQFFCLGSPINRGAWWATSPCAHKESRRLGSLPALKSWTPQGGWLSTLSPAPCQRDVSHTEGLAHTQKVPTAAPRRLALGAGPFPKCAVGWITHGEPALPGASELLGPLFSHSHVVSKRQREAEIRGSPSETP